MNNTSDSGNFVSEEIGGKSAFALVVNSDESRAECPPLFYLIIGKTDWNYIDCRRSLFREKKNKYSRAARMSIKDWRNNET